MKKLDFRSSCNILCHIMLSAFLHTPCCYYASNQICSAKPNEGFPSRLPIKEGKPCEHPLWTGSQNNSNHIWQQRMRGENTHIWQGAQMSFHLRRTLKGDRRHPPCQDDVLAIGVIPRRSRQKTICTAPLKKNAVLTDRAPNDLIMIRNKCHSGEPDAQMPFHN